MVWYTSLNMSSSDTLATPTTATLTGRVKWFNNKSGFGFITVCDGEFDGKDMFVHYSSVQVSDEQYKYLVQGEYVNFELVKPAKGDHEFHAVNVKGIKGGSLMCETRKQNYTARTEKPSRETVSKEVSQEIAATPRRARRPARATEATTSPVDEGYQKVIRKRSSKRTSAESAAR